MDDTVTAPSGIPNPKAKRSYIAAFLPFLLPDDDCLSYMFRELKIDPDNPLLWKPIGNSASKDDRRRGRPKQSRMKDIAAMQLLLLEAVTRTAKAKQYAEQGRSKRNLTYRDVGLYLKEREAFSGNEDTFRVRANEARKRLKANGWIANVRGVVERYSLNFAEHFIGRGFISERTFYSGFFAT
jgi:hypothetical protein